MSTKWCDSCECINGDNYNFCPTCGTELKIVKKIKSKLYLHSDNMSMLEKGNELGLNEIARENFSRVGYEVEIDIEINTLTGDAYATHLNGTELESGVKV